MPENSIRVAAQATTQAVLILAHGAGAPMDSPFMEDLAQRLAALSIETLRFEFPYMLERRRSGKKSPPNKPDVLLSCFADVIASEKARSELPLFIGGKSLGGRMAATLANSQPARGVICFGYPFHPTAQPHKLRTDVLHALQKPALIIQGTRDKLGNSEEVAGYGLPSSLEIAWLEDGDHDLKPRKKSGWTHHQHLDSAAQRTAEFIAGHC